MKNVVYLISVVVVIVLFVSSLLVDYFNPSTYSSEAWKQVEPSEVDRVIFEPIESRNVSQLKTIASPVLVEEKYLITNIVAQLNGKYSWGSFGVDQGFTSGKRLNMRIVTTDRDEYLFRVEFYKDDSFATYSEIYKDYYIQFAASQKQYGHNASSAVLCDLVKMILQKRNVSWVPAYEDKNPGGFFQPSYEEWQKIKRARAGVKPLVGKGVSPQLKLCTVSGP